MIPLILATLRDLLRSRHDLILENLALRQQLLVLERTETRPRFTRADRAFWVALSRCWRHWRRPLRLVKPSPVIAWHRNGWRLYTLQLGHRVSVDLDFFHHEDFEVPPLREALAGLGKFEVSAMAPGTLHCRLDGIRLTFLRSEVPFLYEPVPYRGLHLADVRDIAAMKVIAVAGRGAKKDFIDLHAYLEAGASFPDLMALVQQSYRNTEFNVMHLLRSLVYFDDAETEPMPKMLSKTGWPEIRMRLEREARDWAP